MSYLSKTEELKNFINSKKLKINKLNLKKINFYYNKIIFDSLKKTYFKLLNLDYTLICSNIVSNIFWIVIYNNYNIKLALFLCDRSIELFNEYIDIAKNKFLNNDLNIQDIKLFIYKRTIGPIIPTINIKNNKIINNLNKIHKSSQLILKLFQNFFINIIKENIKYHFDNIISILSNIIENLYLKNANYFLQNLINQTFKNIKNIIIIVNSLKIKFEIYQYILIKNKNNNEISIKKYNKLNIKLDNKELKNYLKNIIKNKDYNNYIKIFNDEN